MGMLEIGVGIVIGGTILVISYFISTYIHEKHNHHLAIAVFGVGSLLFGMVLVLFLLYINKLGVV